MASPTSHDNGPDDWSLPRDWSCLILIVTLGVVLKRSTHGYKVVVEEIDGPAARPFRDILEREATSL